MDVEAMDVEAMDVEAMDVEAFIRVITPQLKEHGFQKLNVTWRRKQSESIAVLNVQKSPWGGGVYYVNLGVYFLALGDLTDPTANKCHVQRRLDIEEPSLVIGKAMTWFEERARLSNAARLDDVDSTKGLVFKEVRSAL